MNKTAQLQEKFHIPVMLQEVIKSLKIKPDGTYVDCTLGDGGHSYAIFKKLNENGKLISFDWDKESINFVKQYYKDRKDNWILVQANFARIADILKEQNILKVDGIVFDLGLSSRQLEAKRGFSYAKNAPLDMRMNQQLKVRAYDLLAALGKSELTKLFRAFGEERYASQIASAIVRERKKQPIKTVYRLNLVIEQAVPKVYDKGRKHKSRRVFQALRLAVNSEMSNLRNGLSNALQVLKPKGRLVVIVYHSLEENMVNLFVQENIEEINIITPLPLKPSASEIRKNYRARSAKLFVFERSNEANK